MPDYVDLKMVYDRMKGRRLLTVGQQRAAAGYLFTILVFARSQRREGKYQGIEQVFRWYADFKGLPLEGLRKEVAALLREAGCAGDLDRVMEDMTE